MNFAKAAKTVTRRHVILMFAASLCATITGAIPASAMIGPGGGGPAGPSVSLDGPVGSIPSTGASGASVTLTGTATSPSGADLTVQWTVDGAIVQTTTVTGSTAISGTVISYTQTYTPGTHTVQVTVSNGTNPPVSSTVVTITVLPPTNTSGGKVTGGGDIPVGTDKGTFGFVAKTNSAGVPQGNFVFQDHSTGRTIKSLQITGLIISGINAEFWGKAMIDDDGEYDFVVDVADVAEPGAGVDTFSIRTSDGYTAGGTVMTGGNIQVHK